MFARTEVECFKEKAEEEAYDLGMAETQAALKAQLMQRRCVKAKSVIHNYYNSSTKPKFYNNTRLAGKIIEKISLTNFY